MLMATAIPPNLCFFFAENFWGSGINYVVFLPSLVANSAAAFAFDMQRDDGVTFKTTIDVVVIQDGLVLRWHHGR
jgi:hypothetical protein